GAGDGGRGEAEVEIDPGDLRAVGERRERLGGFVAIPATVRDREGIGRLRREREALAAERAREREAHGLNRRRGVGERDTGLELAVGRDGERGGRAASREGLDDRGRGEREGGPEDLPGRGGPERDHDLATLEIRRPRAAQRGHEIVAEGGLLARE